MDSTAIQLVDSKVGDISEFMCSEISIRFAWWWTLSGIRDNILAFLRSLLVALVMSMLSCNAL